MIKYYIYEMEMPEEYKKAFEETSREKNITTDQLLCGWLRDLVDNPTEAEKIKVEWDALSEEERANYNKCRLVRIYPVHDGETEELARARAVCEENYGRPYPLPEISQGELIEHIEDDDFFLTYGNPVVVRCDNGFKALYIAWPLAERMLRQTGAVMRRTRLSGKPRRNMNRRKLECRIGPSFQRDNGRITRQDNC
jgi:hypothetical protein